MSNSREVINSKTIKQFKADDMSAFDVIYRKYNKKLYRFAYSILKIKSDAEEIVQEVFIKVWENRNKIDEYLSFESYLFTITYNSTISFIRKRTKESQYIDYLKSIQHPSIQPNIIPELEYNELKDKSEKIIELLPHRQKQIYKLNREEGLTYKEIAVKLNISINTVETHMERALKVIRKKLGDISIVLLIFYYLFV
jgi:RNA polymerase sigma-70 factor (ECF subfamily)